MNEPKSLDSLFTEKIFRIPDYQRGYAWQKSQFKDFWEDLINLSDNRSHYTGVLTLKEASSEEISDTDNESWLVQDHSYKMYYIVDGQQRLTTFILFLQAFIDFFRQLGENAGKSDQRIYITENSLSLEAVISRYLYKTRPTDGKYRTYKFGYTEDNPSYKYLKHKIFNQAGSSSIKETFYTLNLGNAKQYFCEQLKELHSKEGIEGLRKIYKKLTKRFLFNEYVIKDELDVFVTFEAMNNRGKHLSGLELLKNRLIYLTTLYADRELDAAGRKDLRKAINSAWKEVYHQLGRNDKHPLNDDDFLKAHWIMFFKYTRKKGNDYSKFLLEEQFPPQRVHKKIARDVPLESPEEQFTAFDIDDMDSDNGTSDDGANTEREAKSTDVKKLQPDEIRRYVDSLKESAVHWFNSHYPRLATDLSEEEKDALDRLSRIGMGYFRPLIMSVSKKEKDSKKRTELFDQIERFIFIVFRLSRARSHYRDSEFYNASREFDRGELTLEDIKEKLNMATTSYCRRDDGIFNSKDFHDYLDKRFNRDSKKGYYDWNGLRYFLYEYELELLSKGSQKKVAWENLLKTSKDKISIEHVFPQAPKKNWKNLFDNVDEDAYPLYSGSLGNLLLLSMFVNSSLQNNDFNDKRNRYSNGSHSEIEVSKHDKWTPAEIKERGLRLLNFMEKRWKIKFEDEKTKEELLFLPEPS